MWKEFSTQQSERRDFESSDDESEPKIEQQEEAFEEDAESLSSWFWTAAKLSAAALFAMSAFQMNMSASPSDTRSVFESRRLTEIGDSLPSYMKPLMDDLSSRKKLFDETPPNEVKYWFEYTGPLQKYFYRYSRSRGKADYFEGRDDSGVVSARFIEETGGTEEYRHIFLSDEAHSDPDVQVVHSNFLRDCIAMGSEVRPARGKGTVWDEWFGQDAPDRCRVLFAMGTVGVGRGTTLLWETNPPKLHAEGPKPWISEQETAATHLERNLQEIDAMCASGLIAARVQILVCEPIPAVWTEWMDSKLPHCGGKAWSPDQVASDHVEERPSPVQVVVTANSQTADTCHDLKSGFMEKRMQDLLLAPPYLENKKVGKTDPTVKTTHPDLISSDDHDLYVGLKWSSLASLRAVHAFMQASADIAAAASSSVNRVAPVPEKTADGKVVASGPSSPFLIPSFGRVSYVSEENSKVAKWRMHGDFFHPALWEINKDSFDTTWIPHSLAAPGSGGSSTMCDHSAGAVSSRKLGQGRDCGQWWVYFNELQMPTTPEVFANDVTPAPVLGGSNFFWMLTERQRRELVKSLACRHEAQTGGGDLTACTDLPQAVIPLGDMQSFLINFTPNTALGKQHVKGHRPGYSRESEREEERQRVRDRKQLHGIEDIEKALFDYNIYPSALFHKDATLKAARARDAVLTQSPNPDVLGPQTVKSSYYDLTITKPRPPVLGWCQAMARRGLCSLFADYFRSSNDDRCMEACGMKKNWTPLKTVPS